MKQTPNKSGSRDVTVEEMRRYIHALIDAEAAFLRLNGLTVDPIGDADANLIKVGVTGIPTFSWKETEDVFSQNKGLRILGATSSPPAANTITKENIPKALINFDGTGTIAIRGSFNVSSITDVGTGDYIVTWDTDFANTNYSINITVDDVAGTISMQGFRRGRSALEIGSARVGTINQSIVLTDTNEIHVIAFGDQ